MTRRLLSTLSLVLIMATAQASARMNEPWDEQRPSGVQRPEVSDSFGSAMGVSLIRLYQRTASRVDTDRSKSYPVSSRYAIQAFEQQGFWLGMFLTADRLIREIDPSTNPHRIYENGRQYIYDPLEANVWW